MRRPTPNRGDAEACGRHPRQLLGPARVPGLNAPTLPLMGRGDLAKTRWKKDRTRKKKEREKRKGQESAPGKSGR